MNEGAYDTGATAREQAAGRLIAALEFGADDLVPAVLQDTGTGTVLMIGFMNRTALERTLSTGYVHFWSRSRGKLWLKGEQSGHYQQVEELRVNCEANSLLVLVRPLGPVCHEGYDTCFFRTVDEDGSLLIAAQRQFDPASVYGTQPSPDPWSLLFGAYEYIRAAVPPDASSTARLMNAPDWELLRGRLADELRELAGVLDGTHMHQGLPQDLILEASQACYWTFVLAVASGIPGEEISPGQGDKRNRDELAGNLHELAAGIAAAPGPPDPAELRATWTAAMLASVALDTDPAEVATYDLAEMRSRAYMEPYFSAHAAP